MTYVDPKEILRKVQAENAAREAAERAANGDGREEPPAVNGPEDYSAASWRQGTFSAETLQNETFPPLKWIVTDILPAEGMTLLCSKPKFGKSWWVLDLCLGCTAGRLILKSIRPMQGDVLYLALEDSKRRLQRRMTKLLPTFVAKWPKRLTIKTEWRRLHEGGLTDIRAWHDETKKDGGKPMLVVIDVLAKVRKPIGNRQLYEADYEALAGLTALANELSIAILVVHHVRKMTADDLMETVSGSFGTTGAVDTILVMANRASGTVLDIRGRDVETAELAIQFSKTTCRWTILGAAAEVHVTEQRAKILAALKEAGEPVTVAALKDATGMSGNALEALLSRMARAGDIKRITKGTYAHKDYEPPSDDKPPRRRKQPDGKPAVLTHLTDGCQDGLCSQPIENGGHSCATLQPDAPDRVLTDNEAEPEANPRLSKPRQDSQDVRTDSQVSATTVEFPSNDPDRQKSGASGSAPTDLWPDFGIPDSLRRCDHCGQSGTPADPLHPYDWPGRPDGIRLHGRCEEPWHDAHHPREGGPATAHKHVSQRALWDVGGSITADKQSS
jgi:AAA domain